MRFAVDPDGNVVPDVAATLPGRGMWVRADRASIATGRREEPVRQSGEGARSKRPPICPTASSVCWSRACRPISGWRGARARLVLGFDKVLRALDAEAPPALLVEASDGAADGKRKLLRRGPCARPENPDD